MKRWLCGFLTISILLSMWSLPAMAASSDGVDLVLPDALQTIEEEAFAGNPAISSVMIMNQVREINSRAFADCSNLRDVYLGNAIDLTIADDAFDGCDRLSFYVYPGTAGEKYARSHGHICNLITQGSPSWEKTMSLVARAGKPAMSFQDGESGQDISTMRVIVRRTVNYLPNIADLNPVDIVAKYNTSNDTYIIQFSTIEDTREAMRRLQSDGFSAYVETDKWSELDLVSGAAIVGGEWTNPDPMGFEPYVEYLSQNNSSGQQVIAIVDSGVQVRSHYSSILLQSKGINTLADYDGQSWQSDSINHGSAIASVIKNCVGNTNVRILPVRVYSGSGDYDDALVAEGIDYAVDNGADIINLSFKLSRSGVVTDAINRAARRGCTVVVAAGNQNRNISNVFPANLSSVITVSGLSHEYELYVDPTDATIGSNFGSGKDYGIDYCAPYSYVRDVSSGGQKFGTSFSAPIIASAIALVNLDKNHTIYDMQTKCDLKTDSNSFGHGMPRLDRLAKVDPKKITLTSTSPASAKVGERFPLTWSIDPSNTTNKTVTPSSSNTDVLDFEQSDDGRIWLKAVGQGTATFTLTVNDSNVSDTSDSITVWQPMINITISGEPEKLIVGNTVQLNAMYSPDNPTTKAFTWHSANNYASVNANGVVTGLADGMAEIYAISDDADGIESNHLRFPVITQPDAESVTLKIDNNIVNGKSYTLESNETATIEYAVSPDEAEQQVDFEVLSGDAVTVTGNVVRAVKVGTAVVMGMASTGRNVKATVTFVVEVPETGVTVTADSTTLNPGDTTTCHATVLPTNATHQEVTWSSNKPSVATVDSSTGVVTAKSSGQAGIIATTYNGKTNSVTITVLQPYTLTFNTNGGSANSSKTVYAGQQIGTLPSDPTRSGCTFKGWYTAANGGSQITATTYYNYGKDITVYAHWESGWVLESAVPSGAKIIATSWSYREDTEDTASTKSEWLANGSYWKQTGSDSGEYATFPSGEYNTNGYSYKNSSVNINTPVDKYYSAMMHEPFSAYNNGTTKREVTNEHAGWIYWHWAYHATYSSSANRIIAYKPGWYGSGSSQYCYGYWYSIKVPKTTAACPESKSSYNTIGQYPSNGRTTYDCTTIINNTNFVPAAHKTADGSIGLCTWRFYRLEYFTSTYTDYQMWYKYYRTWTYRELNAEPQSTSTITVSNKVKYVKWSNNQ